MSKPLYNKSKTYLLPLIAPMIGIENDFFEYVDNTYMFNDGFEECFLITHDFSFRNPEFTKYEYRLTNNYLFQKLFDISSDKVVYVFKFPEEYLHEYYCLRDSKYSEFGEDAKEQILNFWTTLYGKSHEGVNFILSIKRILYKDKLLKEQLEKSLKVKLDNSIELGEKVQMVNETFVLE
jgi:hypothetical protein